MSWNTCVLLAENKSRSDMELVIPDVFLVTDRTVGWEEATSFRMSPNVALGELQGWGVIWTANDRVVSDPDVLEAASSNGRAFAIVFGGVSVYYALHYLFQRPRDTPTHSRA